LSGTPVVSADGNFVAFTSYAPDLVSGQIDATLSNDLFLWNRSTGALTLVSHDASSTVTGGTSTSFVRSFLSADGRYVAFSSMSSNLVAGGDSGGYLDVFLYDRDTGVNTLVSHQSGSPATPANNQSTLQGLSADGRYLVFSSLATDIAAGLPGVFLYDRDTGTITRLAAGSEGTVSADGNWIALTSPADLVAGQTDPKPASATDVYLYERQTGAFLLVSHASGAALTSGNDTSLLPSLSADGRFVAYISGADDLVSGQMASTPSQGFLYDRLTGTNILVSHAAGLSTTPADSSPAQLRLSGDGRFVVSWSTANNLIAGQISSPGRWKVFRFDRTTGQTVMISHTSDSPLRPGVDNAYLLGLSADGRWIGLLASALHPDDCGFAAALLRDADTDALEIVSRPDPADPSLTGSQESRLLTLDYGAGPDAFSPASDDGRFVVFHSWAVNLSTDATDGNLARDVFLHDRLTGGNTLVSGSAASADVAANRASQDPQISGDGRWVVFTSQAGNLVPGQVDPGGLPKDNVFLYDRVTRSKRLVSHSAGSSTAPGDGYSHSPAISGDGRFVAYISGSSDLVPGQTEPGFPTDDLFLFDRASGATTLISRNAGTSAETPGVASSSPRISADGRYVVFESVATTLLSEPVQYQALFQIYLYDRLTGTITLVSRAAGPTPATGNATSIDPEISVDGRFIAFRSFATDLVSGQVDTNGTSDVFLFDQALGTMTLVSHVPGAPATAANALSEYHSVSGEGSFITFLSSATDLVPGQVDSAGSRDVFLFDRRTGEVALVSHAATSSVTAADGVSTLASVDAGGQVVFASLGRNLVSGQNDPAGTADAFLYDSHTGTSRLLSGAGGSGTTTGQGPNHGPSYVDGVAISRNGRSAYFVSSAIDLVPGDYNEALDVFADSTPEPATDFYTIAPCRLLDTRTPQDGPALVSDTQEMLAVNGACGIPPTARALVVNITVVGATGQGNLKLHPGGLSAAESSTINFAAGQTRANNAIVTLTPGVERGLAITPFVVGGGTVHVLVDVSGWFE
jgi:Tol biopolymer transport system component